MISRLLCLLVLWPVVLFAAPAKVRFEQSARTVDLFDFIEITVRVQEASAGNPFLDTSLTGTVVLPSGATANVDGFCDAQDGSVFRLRFMPATTGRHRYSIRLRQGASEVRHDGAFVAKKGRQSGPVRVDPEHPFHFVRLGSGEHWFWNATTTYQLLAWDDETIAKSVERLAKLGVNRIRVALAGRTKDGRRWNEPLVVPTEKFAFKMEPWLAARPANLEDPGYDVTRFNLDHFRKTERLLRLCRERDLIVSLIFYVDGRDKGVDPFGKERMGGPDEQRYYRYAIARLAPFANVMWDVTNEYRLFRDDAWAEKMGAFIRERDPYDHLISVHGHEDFRFRKSSWADFAMYQKWDEAGGYQFMLKNRRDQAATGRPMPQVNEEYGYEDHYPTGWGGAKVWPARIADSRRRLAWEITMAGCYQTTGERANDGTGAAADTGGGWVNGRGNDHMTMLLGYQRLMRFFTSIPWWTLEPREDLAGPGTWVLAQPGKRYVAYVPKDGVASLRVAPGHYAARWFNPRTGEWHALPQLKTSVEDVWTSPKAPDAGDWALLLESIR